ncbi:hypothetical protein GCM10009555_040990 [Acrocarpospora macrocephala]|uniref:Uncharacterized protein n=1 Tax=Acrocarpospora macrocephala TaxID=150177 RepID=A0A5M3WP38_9ACTN|nr:hypothetical protein [Acrocarpospora macrocephala]GES09929.1 hypothetical protein Amac_035250 [Acrocarpospora macrocephala]
MREHRGVSREELKHSAVVTVTVLMVLGLVAAWSVLIPGVMVWDNIVVAVIGSLRLTGPVAAAFAAWVAVRKRRATRGERTIRQALKAPLAILAVVIGSFGATVLVLTLRAVLSEQAGALLPSGLAMGAAGLALYVVLGWMLGWGVPYAITPMLAGLATYALFTWIAEGSGWADRLAPAPPEPYDLFQGLSDGAFLDQTIWLLGISAALLLSWAAAVTRQPLALAAAMLAVLAAGTGVARLVSEPDALSSAQKIVYSCQEWPITVCVHPGMRGGLTELGSAFTGIAARLSGTPAAFQRVEQRSRLTAGAEDAARGVIPIHVDDLDTGYADRAAAEFVERLSRPCTEPVSAGYRAIVAAWLRGEPLPAGPLLEHQNASAWFSGLSEEQRREWLRMFYADFANCRLSVNHFGGLAYAPRPSPTPLMPVPLMPASPPPGGMPSPAM